MLTRQGKDPILLAVPTGTEVDHRTAVMRGIGNGFVHIQLVSGHPKYRVFQADQICNGTGKSTGAP